MKKQKDVRRTLGYKVRQFFRHLEGRDIERAAYFIYNNIMTLITFLLLLGFIAIVPSLFIH